LVRRTREGARKPFSGRFNVRINPDIHAKAVIVASRLEIFLNRFNEKATEDEALAIG